MHNAEQILVIIVSSALAIFLIFFIVALAYLIGVLKQIKNLTTKAEVVAESVESAAATVRRSASPLAILRVLAGIFNSAQKARGRKD